jgi:hypothetical protein
MRLSQQPVEKKKIAARPGLLSSYGLVRLRLATAGLYRISGDQPFWIDVVAGGELAQSTSYQGAAGCNAPHKIVQFTLPAGQVLVLQVSGSGSAHARLAVTAAPPPPAAQ